jgi:hypothetical protein
MRYDTTQPRISVISPGDEDGVQREMEIGQASTWGEAEFFAKVCGYRISIAEWNGQCYKETQYLLPADYQ